MDMGEYIKWFENNNKKYVFSLLINGLYNNMI